MAKIGLSDGFSLIPEGTHVFKITGVSYKEAFGKLEVTMQTQSGAKHIERFSLLKADGSTNEGALNAFSYFAKTALQDFELSEIDHEDLVGHFIECDIEHDVQDGVGLLLDQISTGDDLFQSVRRQGVDLSLIHISEPTRH